MQSSNGFSGDSHGRTGIMYGGREGDEGRRRRRKTSLARALRVTSTHGVVNVSSHHYIARHPTSKKDLTQQSEAPSEMKIRIRELKDGLLSDFMIKCQEKCFRVHKTFLILYSGYFHRLFTGETVYKELDEIEIDDPLVSSECLEELLKYIYLEDIDISVNSRGILDAAVFLEMDEIINQCCEQLSECKEAEKLLDVWNIFCKYDKREWEEQVIERIAVQLNEIQITEDFLHLPFERLCFILDTGIWKDTSSPAGLLRGICRWIWYSPKNRYLYLTSLMKYIDFSKLSLSCLVNFLDGNPIVESLLELKWNIIKAIVKYHTSKLQDCFVLCHVIPPTTISISLISISFESSTVGFWSKNEVPSFRQSTMSICGSSLYFVSSSIISIFNLNTKDWISLPYGSKLCLHPEAFAVVADDIVYAIFQNQVEKFHLPESFDGWKPMPSMLRKPLNPALVSINGLLHIIDSDFHIQYWDEFKKMWFLIDKSSVCARNAHLIREPFVATAVAFNTVYLLKESNWKLYKISLPTYSVYSHSLPVANSLVSHIRCMAVNSYNSDRFLCVKLLDKKGNLATYNGVNQWDREPNSIPTRSQKSKTWELKTYVVNEQGKIFPVFKVDFALVTTVREESFLSSE